MAYKLNSKSEKPIAYKGVNVLLLKRKKYILRNEWTGKEKIIPKQEAMKMKKGWNGKGFGKTEDAVIIVPPAIA